MKRFLALMLCLIACMAVDAESRVVKWKASAVGEDGDYTLRIECYIEPHWIIFDRTVMDVTSIATKIDITPGPGATLVDDLVDVTEAHRTVVPLYALELACYDGLTIFEQNVKTRGNGPFSFVIDTTYYPVCEEYALGERNDRIEFVLDPSKTKPYKKGKNRK